ncbi:MAG: DoxX family protein [Gemmatimonadaceae bacterium]
MSSTPLFASSPRQQGLALAIMRVVVGIVFIAHGYQKLFVSGLAGITEGFAKMGTPMPTITAPLVTFLELFGGIGLVIGLLTRLIALGLVFDMLGAIFLVHLANGFFLPAGYEFVLMLMVASLALFVGGPGRFSVDEMIANRR